MEGRSHAPGLPATREEGRMDESVSHAREHPDLKRGIGPWLLLFFVLGDIVGAGIYALVGEVGALVGGAIWAAFLAAFFLALFTASSYAELVTKYPRAGGSATYVNNAFKSPFVSFMVAFAVMASGITSACTLTLAFSGDYLAQFISVPIIGAALVFMVLIGCINFYGISESVRINVILTCVEITGLVLIVVIGAAALSTGAGDPGRAFEFKEGTSVLTALLAGTVLAFYALIGFDDSVNVAEETQHPSRNYPRAIFGALLLAGFVYLLVTFTASMVVPTATLADSSGPLLEVVKAGPIAIPPQLFAAIALLAVSNGALINMIMASRISLRYGRPGGHAHRLLQGAPWSAHTLDLDPFHHDHSPAAPGYHRRQRRGSQRARQHHGRAPTPGVHHGEHLGPRAAARRGGARALPDPDGVPGSRGRGRRGAPHLSGRERHQRLQAGGRVPVARS